MDEIKGEIRKFIVENFLFGDDSNLSDDTSFLSEGIIDSTGILELVEFIEDKYGFRVDDEELVPENLDSIKSLEAYIRQKNQTAA